jgi:hypothetical protein
VRTLFMAGSGQFKTLLGAHQLNAPVMGSGRKK